MLLAGSTAADFIPNVHRGDLFVDTLRASLITGRLGATILDGLVGTVDIPKQTASSSAQWVAENAAVTATDATLTDINLSPLTVGALTSFSRRTLLSAVPSVEDSCAQRSRQRYRRSHRLPSDGRRRIEQHADRHHERGRGIDDIGNAVMGRGSRACRDDPSGQRRHWLARLGYESLCGQKIALDHQAQRLAGIGLHHARREQPRRLSGGRHVGIAGQSECFARRRWHCHIRRVDVS